MSTVDENSNAIQSITATNQEMIGIKIEGIHKLLNFPRTARRPEMLLDFVWQHNFGIAPIDMNLLSSIELFDGSLDRIDDQ